MSILTTQNLSLSFGDFDLFQGISIRIENRSKIGLIGPNGIGKTSLMLIMAGVNAPSSGSVHIARGRRIGYLPESVPLYTDMTVRAYLRFSATVRGLRGRRLDKRLGEILHRCRLEEYKDTLIGKLSKGFRQRNWLSSLRAISWASCRVRALPRY